MNPPKSKAWIPLTVFMLIGVLLGVFGSQYFHFYKVRGNSMDPSFVDGQLLVLLPTSIQQGALVIFEAPENWQKMASAPTDHFFKRVVASKGDSVDINTEGLFVNNKKVSELPQNCQNNKAESIVLEDEIFVLGDNRNSSVDSLYSWCQEDTFLVSFDRISFVGKERF